MIIMQFILYTSYSVIYFYLFTVTSHNWSEPYQRSNGDCPISNFQYIYIIESFNIVILLKYLHLHLRISNRSKIWPVLWKSSHGNICRFLTENIHVFTNVNFKIIFDALWQNTLKKVTHFGTKSTHLIFFLKVR